MHSITKLLQLLPFFSQIVLSDVSAPTTPMKKDIKSVFKLYCATRETCSNADFVFFKKNVYPNMMKKGTKLLKNRTTSVPSSRKGGSTDLSGSSASRGKVGSENPLSNGKLSNQKKGESSGRDNEEESPVNGDFNSLSGEDSASTTLVTEGRTGRNPSTLNTFGKGASRGQAGEEEETTLAIGRPGTQGGKGSSALTTIGKGVSGALAGGNGREEGEGGHTIANGRTRVSGGETEAFSIANGASTGGQGGSTIASLGPGSTKIGSGGQGTSGGNSGVSGGGQETTGGGQETTGGGPGVMEGGRGASSGNQGSFGGQGTLAGGSGVLGGAGSIGGASGGASGGGQGGASGGRQGGALGGGQGGLAIAGFRPGASARGPEASGGASRVAGGRGGSGGSSSLSSSVTFLAQINAPKLAGNVALLQDNTVNMKTIVHSTRDSGRSLTSKAQLRGPAVVTGLDSPQGRHLASDDQETTTILFCDVPGNALWRWKRANTRNPIAKPTLNDSKIDNSNDICSDSTISLEVIAHQAGCSLQNHPEGCQDIEQLGCGGIAVNPLTNRATIARTGGGTLGTLQFKRIGDVCQGQIVDVISSYRGQPLQNPSSVEYTSRGTLYFTDSFEPNAHRSQNSTPTTGVYVLGNGPSASVELLDCGMARPNKLAFSPDEKHMYVTNSEPQNAYIQVFDLGVDGSIQSSRLLFNISAHPQATTGNGFADGIKLDADGNIYVVCYHSILIISPSGTLLGTLTSDHELYDLTIGHNAIYVTGEYGISVYETIVDPAIPIRKTVIDC
uniref:Carbohydrate esterase putative n=1 Tax=Albugo laibachii Nc14 TaxID=890382 RepID=F0WCA8_9STRA|nr:carbohydrate esterase putative [Albugo laibachii Nc14]|eukprot:CCA18822.1 carbohydrate esterase putative [Albugo laibachii Nc14]